MIIHVIRSARERFFQGPRWLRLPDFITDSKYRSVTIMGVVWLYSFFIRSLTPVGQLALPASVIVVLYTLFIPPSPVNYLAFALLSVFFVDFVIGFIFRPRLRFRRYAPARHVAGEPIQMIYDITNKSRLPCWGASFDTLSLPSGFSFSREPTLAAARGRSTTRVSGVLNPLPRGVYQLAPPNVRGAYPFGLTQWTSVGEGALETLVYPAYAPLSRLELNLSATGYAVSETRNAMAVGESTEFAACREYHAGDDPRRIHWPATIRIGRPIVKEFQDEHSRRVALLLETYRAPLPPRGWLIKRAAPGSPQAFEAALSLTAATEEYICLSVLFNGTRVILKNILPERDVQVNVKYRERENPYRSVSGRMLLALSDDASRRNAFQLWGLPGARWPEIKTERDFIIELNRIQEAGICLSRDADIISFSVPVRIARRDRVASLGVFMPAYRFQGEETDSTLMALRDMAKRLEKK